MPRKVKTEEEATKCKPTTKPTTGINPMTKEEAMQIIEAVARGEGTKMQTEAAKEWLRINGAGEIFTKYQLEIVHTYKTEKQELPELKI